MGEDGKGCTIDCGTGGEFEDELPLSEWPAYVGGKCHLGDTPEGKYAGPWSRAMDGDMSAGLTGLACTAPAGGDGDASAAFPKAFSMAVALAGILCRFLYAME